MITLIHAHPYPARSRAVAALLAAVRDLRNVEVRSLYSLYPDFDIDAAAERGAVGRATALVLLHPLYWYTTPALLKHWFDTVLTKGFAYGEGGTALHGKTCLWAVTTGGDMHAFSESGRHQYPFATFTPVVEQTVRYCGMTWAEPFVVHGAHQIADAELADAAAGFRKRVQALEAT
jgi:glutathione-regulated potassium-efflux system ancillary protein KefF